MSYPTPNIVTYLSDYDFSSKQYYFCKIGSADNIVTLCGSGEKALGIIMNKPTSGQAAEVAFPGGGALLKVSETVAPGDYLSSMATGQGEITNTAGDHVGAYCLVTGSANDLVSVNVTCFEAYNAD